MNSGSTRMDGFLTKRGRAQWKRRWFILENDAITYFSKQGDLRPQGRMVLFADSTVTNLPTTRAHAFQVTCTATDKKLIAYADTKEERDRWVAAFNKTITGLKKSRAQQPQIRRNVR